MLTISSSACEKYILATIHSHFIFKLTKTCFLGIAKKMTVILKCIIIFFSQKKSGGNTGQLSASSLRWIRSWEKLCSQQCWPGLADRLGARISRQLFVCFSTPLTSELAPLNTNVSWATPGEETQEAQRPSDSAKRVHGGITLVAFPLVQSTSDTSRVSLSRLISLNLETGVASLLNYYMLLEKTNVVGYSVGSNTHTNS